ncbi:MAG: hypothetical protein LBK72_02420 [Bifidobacteriaceae bacterium]|nr:hypothetical protein [Bifidobacteriaceae bacterium]
MKLAPGVEATMPLTRELVGLALAELRQKGGDIAGAVEIVESLEPSVPAAALARRSQPTELKHHTLVERAMTYQRERKRAMARKDLERIPAVDPNYPGLAGMLSALG